MLFISYFYLQHISVYWGWFMLFVTVLLFATYFIHGRNADDEPPMPTYQISKEKVKSLAIDFIPLEVSLKDTMENLKEKNFIKLWIMEFTGNSFRQWDQCKWKVFTLSSKSCELHLLVVFNCKLLYYDSPYFIGTSLHFKLYIDMYGDKIIFFIYVISHIGQGRKFIGLYMYKFVLTS